MVMEDGQTDQGATPSLYDFNTGEGHNLLVKQGKRQN